MALKAILVEDQLTPLSPPEAIAGMKSAIWNLTGKYPTAEHVAVLIGQSALETGHWKSIHRYNVGNAKAGPNYEGYYCQFRCNEIINGKVEWFDPPHPQTNFRAFMTAEAGFADHIRLLATSNRYAKAWQCAERGDPDAYSRACAAAGYYTANVDIYTKTTVQLFQRYLTAVRAHYAEPARQPFEIPEDPPPLETDASLRALAMQAAEDSRFANLERLRVDAMREMSGLESEPPVDDEPEFLPREAITKTDRPKPA